MAIPILTLYFDADHNYYMYACCFHKYRLIFEFGNNKTIRNCVMSKTDIGMSSYNVLFIRDISDLERKNTFLLQFY